MGAGVTGVHGRRRCRAAALAAAGALLGVLADSARAADALAAVRVFRTEPAVFEFLFTGAVPDADGIPRLAFNHRSGATRFVRPGDDLGRYRVASFEAATQRVFYASLNAWLDEPRGRVTLAGPGPETAILEQGRPLPWRGRAAWLARLDTGAWWSTEEMDVFFADGQPVAVEEIDDASATVSVGMGLRFIPPIAAAEQEALQRLWADRARQEQAARDAARDARRRAAATPAPPAGERTATPAVSYPAPVRGPSRFVYGCEARFPTAFRVSPGIRAADGRLIQAPFIVPSAFESRFSGMSIRVP